jgi:hypothetical protein
MPELIESASTLPSGANTLEGIKVIDPFDGPALEQLAAHMGAHPQFWEDRMRVNPVQSFAEIFANPRNVVFDLHGDGVVAFVVTFPNFMAYVYGFSWGPKAMGPSMPFTWRVCAASAMIARNLHVVHGLTAWNNTLARRANRNSGMRFRGRIKDALSYNGVVTDAAWYELSRHDLGLPPLEG